MRPARDARRAHVRARRLEAGAEAVDGRAPSANASTTCRGEARACAVTAGGIEAARRAVRRAVRGVPEHTAGAGELLVGEEAGLPVAHARAAARRRRGSRSGRRTAARRPASAWPSMWMS